MSIPIFQVDAFTERPFAGNPAAVCLLAGPRDDGWLQAVAAEMNLSETAFLMKEDDGYRLRWFTPKVEVALCGHATLASAHVLFQEGFVGPDDTIRFHTLSGLLTVTQNGEEIELDFSLDPDDPIDPPENLSFPDPLRFGLALGFLDGWMYVWHRANHGIPILWRFHRMHHSDRNMDVTTATRFHLGEQVLASLLRLGLIPLLGIEIWNLVIYDALVLAVILFHHADVSLGRWDCWLRWLIVTPDMHKVHHSDQQPETDSNYSTVLSIWDRLARSFRMRSDPRAIVFGLKEFTDSSWQSWWGMWKTPFSAIKRVEFPPPSDNPRHDADGVTQQQH